MRAIAGLGWVRLALDRKLLRDLARLWSQALTIALVVASGIGGFITSLSVQRVEDALQVPVSAVFPWNEGERRGVAVFLVQSGSARIAPVELGGRNGDQAWIRGGLEAGATVIVYPPPGVKDGGRVKVRKS